jgi:hypothetical protein
VFGPIFFFFKADSLTKIKLKFVLVAKAKNSKKCATAPSIAIKK